MNRQKGVNFQPALTLLDRAGQTSITEACRTFGISRTTYYRWADRAERYGLAALMPKGRRSPAMPNAVPPETVEIVLAEAVARPTLGARRLLEHLAERDVMLSASGVQKLLVRHCLGRRNQRVAALAQITAMDTGLVTEAAKDGPFGFCHFAARPGDLVALDTFYVGKLKGVGTVWQRPRSTPPPGGPSAGCSWATRRPRPPLTSSTTSSNGWLRSLSSSPGC